MKAVARFSLLSRAVAPQKTRFQAISYVATQTAFACNRSHFPTALRLRVTRFPSRFSAQSTRQHSNDARTRPLTDSERSLDNDSTSTAESDAIAERKAQQPAYEITFTCRKCATRSSHRISKQAYHYGTTLITCPECKNRHLISDHLKIFSDKSVTIEDILKEKGELLKKGRLGDDGDVEFYSDRPESDNNSSR